MSPYTARIAIHDGGDAEVFEKTCKRYGFETEYGRVATRIGDDWDEIALAGNAMVADLRAAGFQFAKIMMDTPKGAYGPAMTILIKHVGTPAAIALDAIASARHEVLSSTAGEWTPALCLDRIQVLIDAEMRLSSGADMEGVARQVAGLCLIALEKLELEREDVARHTREAAKLEEEGGAS